MVPFFYWIGYINTIIIIGVLNSKGIRNLYLMEQEILRCSKNDTFDYKILYWFYIDYWLQN